MATLLVEVAAHADGGGFAAAQFRDRVGTGRSRHQILDFFDRHGVTLGRGDLQDRPASAGLVSAAVLSSAANGGEIVPGGAFGLQSEWGSETVPGGSTPVSSPAHPRVGTG